MLPPLGRIEWGRRVSKFLQWKKWSLLFCASCACGAHPGTITRPARLEFGYLLSVRELDRSDGELAGNDLASKGSSSAPSARGDHDLAEALRGQTSLGGLLSCEFACVPSPGVPSPKEDACFNGGYSTRRHTRDIPGLQIEAPFAGVRHHRGPRALRVRPGRSGRDMPGAARRNPALTTRNS